MFQSAVFFRCRFYRFMPSWVDLWPGEGFGSMDSFLDACSDSEASLDTSRRSRRNKKHTYVYAIRGRDPRR